MSKLFVDTNLFVYALDQKEPSKKEKARVILKKVTDEHCMVISTQVIQEFYVVATTKLKVDRFVVKNIIHNFRNLEIVNSDLDMLEQAVDISIISQVSFWDALIIAAAEKANCDYILSEDLNAGQTYRGVSVINPFLQESF